MIIKTRKLTLSLIILLSFIGLLNAKKIKTEQIKSKRYEIRENEWYKEQSKLWKLETKNNPKNGNAWRNYFHATRYVNDNTYFEKDKQTTLKQIVENLKKEMPKSFESYLLEYAVDNNPKNIKLLEKAFKINPDDGEILYDFVVNYERTGKPEKRIEYSKRIHNKNLICPGLLDYAYNMMISVEKNGILLVNGDNDTFPCWILQDALDIRKDILILNISLANDLTYLKSKIDFGSIEVEANLPYVDFDKFLQAIKASSPGRAIYFATTISENFSSKYKDKLYSVGIVERLSEESIDNIAYLKKNVEKKYRWDNILIDWYDDNVPAANLLYTNYLPSIIKLINHYKIVGETKHNDMLFELGYKIAELNNRKEIISYLDHLKK